MDNDDFFTEDLEQFDRSFDLNRHTWNVILKLAKFFGWRPQGTLSPVMFMVPLNGTKVFTDIDIKANTGQWDGNYYSNSGQEVTAIDVEMLIEALNKLLAELASLKERSQVTINEIQWDELLYEDLREGAMQWEEFDSEMNIFFLRKCLVYEDTIKEFLKFLKQGPFIIM